MDRPEFRRIVHLDKPIPVGIWIDKYRKKFNWKVSVNNLEQSKLSMRFKFFNGESYSLYNDDFSNMKYQEEVLPEYLIFKFIKNNVKYKAYFEFGENELFNYFEEISQNNLKEPIEMVINISSDLQETSIQLQTKEKSYSFEKMKEVAVYSY